MIDFEYLCTKMADMTGLPIRIYKEKQLSYYYCVVPLLMDPIAPYLSEILDINKHIDYYLTRDFDTYGILNGTDITIVIGPSFSTNISLQHLRKKAFDLQVEASKADLFVNQLNSLVRMPLNSILQILCTMNYIVNNEKLSLDDITLEETTYEMPHPQVNQQDSYRSFFIEKKLCDFIKNGDLTGFESWVRQAPTVKAGKVANDTLRQHKNIFIVSATLFSRSAIEAGLDINESLQLSDAYIQQCESKDTVDSITNLQFSMLMEFIKKVHEIKELKADNYLTKKVLKYINNNLSNAITTSDIAVELNLSRSYLSTTFKKENDIDLKDFIQLVKINHAKQLLIESNNSLLQISTYLGYSSNSHFTKMFTRFVQMSPSQYRKQYKTK